MIAINAKCPDCATDLTVTRELADDLAEVLPDTCPGCCRRWRATIHPMRMADASVRYFARLYPAARLAGGR